MQKYVKNPNYFYILRGRKLNDKKVTAVPNQVVVFDKNYVTSPGCGIGALLVRTLGKVIERFDWLC